MVKGWCFDWKKFGAAGPSLFCRRKSRADPGQSDTSNSYSLAMDKNVALCEI
jgi:hypothetical protein